MEIIIRHDQTVYRPSVVLFDFDGTISLLRRGWEKIMEPMMMEMLTIGKSPVGDYPIVKSSVGDYPMDNLHKSKLTIRNHSNRNAPDPDTLKAVRDYISQSTGIQTIYQMQWLAEKVRESGHGAGLPDDPWWYKAEYNRRLMKPVNSRIRMIQNARKMPDDFLVAGSRAFLEALKKNGCSLFAASGTDHRDVVREAEILGVSGFFDRIIGAPEGQMACSKEALMRSLVADGSFKPTEMAVVGDGKVEIALGRQFGALTLGIASDERRRSGISPVKRERLVKAGAHAISGDFTVLDELIAWLGIGVKL